MTEENKSVNLDAGRAVVPPAAAAPVHSLPMAPGQMVSADAVQGGLTPLELAMQQRVANQQTAVPDTMSEQVRQIAAEAVVPQFPVDPTNMQPGQQVTIDQLPPEQQAAIRAGMAQQAATPPPEQAAAFTGVPSMGSQAVPGYVPPGSPYPPAQPVYNPAQAAMAQPAIQPSGEVVLPPPPQRAPEPPPQQPPAQQPPQQPQPEVGAPGTFETVEDYKARTQAKAETETIVLEDKKEPEREKEVSTLPAATVTHCPHCTADLSMPETPEPSNTAKQAFIHAFLGDLPYTESFNLFGGALQVTFRTLTVAEIDAVYDQVSKEFKAGKLTTALMQAEQVKRYRLCLQLHKMASPDGKVSHTMPMNLDEWTLEGSDPPLVQIRQQIIGQTLKTESLLRVIGAQLERFNRVVSKLEVMVFNSDFWKPTGARS